MKISPAKCFTCGMEVAPGSASAYCTQHQPAKQEVIPVGRQCFCPSCQEMFTTVTSFDAHQKLNTRTGVVTCKDPRTMRARNGTRLMVLTKRGWSMNPERSAPTNPWWEKRQA